MGGRADVLAYFRLMLFLSPGSKIVFIRSTDRLLRSILEQSKKPVRQNIRRRALARRAPGAPCPLRRVQWRSERRRAWFCGAACATFGII